MLSAILNKRTLLNRFSLLEENKMNLNIYSLNVPYLQTLIISFEKYVGVLL